MNEWFSNTFEQIRAMPRQRQILLAATGLGSFAFVGWLALGMGAVEYRALYRGLPEDEIARIADVLNEEQIDYRLGDGATSISVPAHSVYEARIRVAGRGLPGGGDAGFEIFDRPAFGVTDFVHRVNYMRAVQGELARSIEQLDAVSRARVQVVIPKRSNVLSGRDRSPRASVVVKLVPGNELGAMQAKAIVHLVASSVEALSPDDVTVVDGSGRLLAPVGDGDPVAQQVGGTSAHQTRIEAELAERVEAILEPVVGSTGVVARVRAQMDWTTSEVTEERFDPDSQVARSEQRTEEIERDKVDGGVPGVASNAGTAGPGTGVEPAPSASSVSETVNYEISKVVSRRSTPMGRIERLSVAVLLDSGVASDADQEQPRFSDEEIEHFEQLAMQAVGFQEKRGDRIVVSAAPFRTREVDVESDAPLFDGELLIFAGKAVGIVAQLLALVLFAHFIVRPMIKAVGQPPAMAGLPATVSSLESELGAGAPAAAAAVAAAAPAAAPTLAEQVGAEAQARSDDSVTTIRNWLNQG